MKISELLAEEGYDTQRDKDAVSGKPRKTSISKGKKPKGYDKDKAEKAALDNIKKMPQFKETTAGAIASSMGNGNGFVNGGPGVQKRKKNPKKKKA